MVEELVDVELSIGDYILTSGAIAAVVVIDAEADVYKRQVPNEENSVFGY